jgi:hypothetical protein
VLNAPATFAEYLFVSLIHPDIVEVRVCAVQYGVFAVHLHSKDGGIRRTEIHLLKASADGLMDTFGTISEQTEKRDNESSARIEQFQVRTHRVFEILVPRRQIIIPSRKVAVGDQFLIGGAPDAVPGSAKRALGPFRHLAVLDATVLDEGATGAQSERRVLGHLVVR